jgi:hypothetical protein
MQWTESHGNSSKPLIFNQFMDWRTKPAGTDAEIGGGMSPARGLGNFFLALSMVDCQRICQQTAVIAANALITNTLFTF